MPITNNASYIPTMNSFLAHWNQVNVVMPAPLLIKVEGVTGPVGAGEFVLQRANLHDSFLEVIDKLNDGEIARGDITIKKPALLLWLNEFVGLLEVYYQGTPFLNARPKVPNVTDGQDRFLTPMYDMLSLWVKLNAGSAPDGLTLPLELSDGTLVADAQAAVAALATSYLSEKMQVQNVSLARSKRDLSKAKAYAMMKAYRVAVASRCAQHPELVDTLPALSPTPGHTPEAVAASAVFEAPDKSRVTYEASTDADLDRYELRGNPGETYSDDDAVVILTNAPGDPLEFLTSFGLSAPGTEVALKVYVVLTMGNEAGSTAMVVARPV